MSNKQIEWSISELMNLKLLCDNWPVDKNIITSFIDILISNAKARTGISIKEIKDYNKEFYEHLDTYFNEKTNLSISDNSEEFKKLCLMFKVPVITNNSKEENKLMVDNTKARENGYFPSKPKGGDIKVRETGNILSRSNVQATTKDETETISATHIDCLNLFNTLSTEEKIKFIMEFQNIEIKLSPSEILVFKSC